MVRWWSPASCLPLDPPRLKWSLNFIMELKNRNDHLRYIPRALHRLTVLNRTDEPLFITQLRSLRITQLFSFTTKNSCLVCLLKLYTLINYEHATSWSFFFIILLQLFQQLPANGFKQANSWLKNKRKKYEQQ